MPAANNLEKFWSWVDKSAGPDGCWPWTGRLGGGCRGERGRFMIRGKRRYAHSIACQSEHGPCPEGKECRHLCGNHICCNPRHLEWSTHKENMSDLLAHGTLSQARLAAGQVIEIRRKLDAGRTQRSVAKEYGVSQTTVSQISRHTRWTNLVFVVVPVKR